MKTQFFVHRSALIYTHPGRTTAEGTPLASVLAASSILNSPLRDGDLVTLNEDAKADCRPATRRDFEAFRVNFEQYASRPDVYEFSEAQLAPLTPEDTKAGFLKILLSLKKS